MAKTDEEIKELVTNSNSTTLLMKCGLKPHNYVTIEHKFQLLNAIWLHYTFFEVHAELQQFRKGFRETLQMEVLLSNYPEEIRALLVSSDNYKVTANGLLKMFTINYSEVEQDKDVWKKQLWLTGRDTL